MSSVQLAMEQIAFARRYALRLIEASEPGDWFRLPPGGVTHIAWQVGHLAMAEYRLCLERLRGRQPGDERIIAEDFLLLFGKNSTPVADLGLYPTAEEIRAALDRVHQQVLAELPHYDDAELAEPPLRPHSIATTKLDCLFWCGQHEMMHAGQIGLLRRLLGAAPLW